MQPHAPQDKLNSQLAALRQPLKGRRLLAWILFLCVAGFALLLPILTSLLNSSASDSQGAAMQQTAQQTAEQTAPQVTQPTLPALDKAWNPGPLSTAHRQYANTCTACHSEPFTRVQDKDCKACHTTIRAHSAQATSADALPDTTRCASCHREHQGDFALLEQNRHFTASNCTSCHSHIAGRAPGTAVEDVSDFANAHPAFRIQVSPDPKSRVRQSSDTTRNQALLESTTLTFPHDAHLVAEGVNSPSGKVKMACKNCHIPTPDGKHFEPITMKEQCQSCHTLNFEPSMPERQVPHGDVDEVLSTLMEFYSFASLNPLPVETTTAAGQTVRQRPGHETVTPMATGNAQQNTVPQGNAQQQALTQARTAATHLFEKSACVICHQVTSVPGPGKANLPGSQLPQWHIAPPATQHAWMPKARFNHLAHKTSDCADCHQANTSTSASDVLMPTIDTCRSCHAGNEPATGKIVSDCGMCHRFHPRGNAQLNALPGANRAPH